MTQGEEEDVVRSVLLFPVQDDRVILGIKLDNEGIGLYNGCGGPIRQGDIVIHSAAVRKFHEETTARLILEEMKEAADLRVYREGGRQSHICVFLCHKWEGRLQTTPKMSWSYSFRFDKLPLKHMHAGDYLWLPRILTGEKLHGSIYYNENGTQVLKHNLEPY